MLERLTGDAAERAFVRMGEGASAAPAMVIK
jgi:hypothetical protein